MAMSKREARRERNREDFMRATKQAVSEAGHDKARDKLGIATPPGTHAGNTYQEHIEDEIRKAVRVHNRLEGELAKASDNPDADLWSATGLEVKRKAARGVIRGLCKALLIYENSYEKDNKNMLIRMEKEFLNEGKES